MAKEFRKAGDQGDPWYRPELANRNYEQFGDAYADDQYDVLAAKWNTES